jgi:hypothetical protein
VVAAFANTSAALGPNIGKPHREVSGHFLRKPGPMNCSSRGKVILNPITKYHYMMSDPS